MTEHAEAAIRMADTEDLLHQALRAAVEVPTTGTLWTRESTFVPPLLDAVYGDGASLFRLTTVNSRPAYYVVRGDASWTVEGDRPRVGEAGGLGGTDIRDHIDEIVEALREQFGEARGDVEDFEDRHGRPPGPDDLAVAPWPALDDETGTSWGRMDWPEIPGLALVDHPLVACESIAGDYAPAPALAP